MKLILHGLLRDRAGPEFTVQASSVADAIEGFARQVELPLGLVIEAVGFDTVESLTASTEATEVHLVPAMMGGGKFATFVLAAIEIIAGVLISTVGGSPQYGIPLIIAGGTTAVVGVINLFMKAPSTSKSADPPASTALGLGVNTVKSGTPIPNAWGRVKLAGHFLSLQSTSSKLVLGQFPAVPS